MASDVFETLREMELECMIPILEQLLACTIIECF